MSKIRISGTGSYLPQNIITNDDLSTILDTNDEWIKTRTGISQRHVAGPSEGTTDMGTEALKNALEMSNLRANDLDAILVTTTTPDLIFPSTAIQIQHRIGMERGFGFDIQTVCSGFVYTLYTAEKFMRAGNLKRIAIVATEAMSRTVNWQDRASCVLFGDGAGAVILEQTDDSESDIIDIILESNASLQPALKAFDLNPFIRNKSLSQISHLLQNDIQDNKSNSNVDETFGLAMNGAAVYKNAVENMTRMSLQILEKNNIPMEKVDWLLLHQANMRITQSIAERLQIPPHRVMESISDCANTSVGTIPITLDKYVRNNPQLKRGDLILMATAGAGMTFSSCLLRW